MNRRQFLRSGSGALLALPLLHGTGHAQQQWPQRLLIFFTPNGTNPETWFPPEGSTELDWAPGRVLAPLIPHQQRLILTSGINLRSGDVGPGEPHQKGMGAVLTGAHLEPGNFVGGDGSLAGWGNGRSVDQRIADHIGEGTRVRSLELGVRVNGAEVRHRINYAGPENPLPPIEQPVEAFRRLFGEADAGAAELARLRVERRSVLDAVYEQFRVLRTRVGRVDRERLDAHAALVRDLEARLRVPTAEACAEPDLPLAINAADEREMARATALQIDMAIGALACDQTRVITLQMSSGANNIRFPHLNSNSDDHVLSHAGPSDQRRRSEWATRQGWYAEQFAGILSRLEAIPEGEGTLLDHTVILWCSELAQGSTHSHDNMPFLLAGGAPLRTGRYLRFDERNHNDLLLTLLHAFGIEEDSYGDANFVQGALPGVLV